MATIGDLVNRSRRMVRAGRREPFNLLDGAHTSSDTQLTLKHPLGKIAIGDYVGIGGEIAYVVAKDEGQQKITVVRGAEGTPAVAHVDGEVLEINWRWFSADLLEFLSDEIRSWPDTIFTVANADVSMGVSARDVSVALTRYRYTLKLYRKISGRPSIEMPIRSYRVETGMPTDQYADGNALIVTSNPDTASYRLVYAQGFNLTALENLTTDLANVGLSANLYDAAKHGVAWRALVGDEAARSNELAQPEPRDADDVSAGDATRAASAFKSIRDLRLEEEERRLRTLYPIRM